MIDLPEEKPEKFFMTKEKFSFSLHQISKEHELSLFDSFLYFCEINGLDVEECQRFIDKNLQEKLKRDYLLDTKGVEDDLDIF